MCLYFFDFTHFRGQRDLKTPKFHSEINCPLHEYNAHKNWYFSSSLKSSLLRSCIRFIDGLNVQRKKKDKFETLSFVQKIDRGSDVRGQGRRRSPSAALQIFVVPSPFLLWREIVLSGYSYCSEYLLFAQQILCLDLLTVRQKVPILDFSTSKIV